MFSATVRAKCASPMSEPEVMVPKWAADLKETVGSKLGWGQAVAVIGGTLCLVKVMADDIKSDVKDVKTDMTSLFILLPTL